MVISVVGRHLEIPDAFKEYAEQKAAKLVKFYDRIQAIEILCREEKENKSVEILVTAEPRRLSFVAREIGDDLVACFDIALDKVSRQLKRHKEKHRNRKGREKAPEIQPSSSEQAEEETSTGSNES